MSPFSFVPLAQQPIPGADVASPSLPTQGEVPIPSSHSHLHLTGKHSGVPCPKCTTETQFADAMGVSVLACPACLGFLSQGKDFSRIVTVARSHYRGQDTIRPLDHSQLRVARTCPTCHQPFETHAYAGPGTTVLDSCQRCGTVWLDGGELERIKQAPGRR
jgi:Zn-finger nucleic acid-binding protein